MTKAKDLAWPLKLLGPDIGIDVYHHPLCDRCAEAVPHGLVTKVRWGLRFAVMVGYKKDGYHAVSSRDSTPILQSTLPGITWAGHYLVNL